MMVSMTDRSYPLDLLSQDSPFPDPSRQPNANTPAPRHLPSDVQIHQPSSPQSSKRAHTPSQLANIQPIPTSLLLDPLPPTSSIPPHHLPKNQNDQALSQLFKNSLLPKTPLPPCFATNPSNTPLSPSPPSPPPAPPPPPLGTLPPNRSTHPPIPLSLLSSSSVHTPRTLPGIPAPRRRLLRTVSVCANWHVVALTARATRVGG